jgi:hypothetical protein
MAWGRPIVVAAVVGSLIACGGTSRNLDSWTGYWWGHDRGLKISGHGDGREVLNDGCCFRAVAMTFRIVQTPSSPASGAAAFRVESVKKWRLPNHKQPHIGQQGRLRLRHGVITDSITGATFCAPNVDRCGA